MKASLLTLQCDMYCRNADDIYSEILAARVRELKETPEGVKSMCREMEELYNEAMEIGEKRGIEMGRKSGLEEGEKNGELKKAKETAFSLSQMGFQIETIAQAVKASVSQTREWIEESY